MPTINSTLPRLLAVTALATGLAFTAPAFAATTSSTTTTSTTTKHHETAMQKAEDVETRIKTLHDKLQITADQEDAFKTVAQAMRDNATDLKTAVATRDADMENQTAPDDLASYQKVRQTEVDGLGKFADAFKPLYDSFSDAQKKNADEMFSRYEGRHPSADNAPASATKG